MKPLRLLLVLLVLVGCASDIGVWSRQERCSICVSERAARSDHAKLSAPHVVDMQDARWDLTTSPLVRADLIAPHEHEWVVQGESFAIGVDGGWLGCYHAPGRNRLLDELNRDVRAIDELNRAIAAGEFRREEVHEALLLRANLFTREPIVLPPTYFRIIERLGLQRALPLEYRLAASDSVLR